MLKSLYSNTLLPGASILTTRKIDMGIPSPHKELVDPSPHKKLVEDTIKNEFYVDDLLTSVDTVEQAHMLVSGVSQTLSEYGIKIHKFASNNVRALNLVPGEDLADCIRDLPSELGEQRTLRIRPENHARRRPSGQG